MSEEEFETEHDPFSEENIRVSNFILLNRIYDVLMGLYQEANPDKARDLLELHLAGNIMGPSPAFNGNFITDLVNAENPYGDTADDESTPEQ